MCVGVYACAVLAMEKAMHGEQNKKTLETALLHETIYKGFQPGIGLLTILPFFNLFYLN